MRVFRKQPERRAGGQTDDPVESIHRSPVRALGDPPPSSLVPRIREGYKSPHLRCLRILSKPAHHQNLIYFVLPYSAGYDCRKLALREELYCCNSAAIYNDLNTF